MRVAALQFFATPFDLVHNLDTAERLARQAATHGARLMVLPAFFNTGYVYAPRLRLAAEAPLGPTTQWLMRLSAELKTLIGGTWLVRAGKHVFNTFVLADPDGRIYSYQQQHPALWEQGYFKAGREPLIVTTALGRVGVLIGWDAAHPQVLETYRDRVDMMLMSSALPRFHRAVLNFPLGKKVYLAQLTPSLLRHREALDDGPVAGIAACAAWLGAPLVHAALAGRFVTELPDPRLSFWLMAVSQPRYWPLALQAKDASLRATFAGASAIVNARGETLARLESEEGVALAEVEPGPTHQRLPRPGPPSLWAHLPFQWRWLNGWLKR